MLNHAMNRLRCGHPRAVLLVLLAVLMPVAAGSCGLLRREKRPTNVILLIVDTLKRDHLGCYGYERGRTPNIDRLAASGARLTQARSAVPLTLPSITSILTSTYPIYHGIKVNMSYALDDSAYTLAEAFQENGYRTAAILGSVALDHRQHLTQGFELYDDDFARTPRRHFEGEDFISNALGPPTMRRAEDVFNEGRTWIEKNGGQPFFLLLHVFDAHVPYDSPEPLPTKEGYAASEAPIWAYDSEVYYLDRQLGLFLDALEEMGLTGSTLFVFTADHGEGLGEHREMTHGHFLYDSTIRVPILFSYPPLIPAETVVRSVFRTIDLMPTILDFVGLTPSHRLQGVSQRAVLEGRGDPGAGPDVSYFETFYNKVYMGWSGLRGVESNGWKYVQAPHPELYDLRDDPGETMNLAGRMPEKVEEMQAILSRQLSLWSPASWNVSKEIPVQENMKMYLESLGYLTNPSDMMNEPDSVLPDPKDMIDEFNRSQEIGGRIDAAGLYVKGGRFDDALAMLQGIPDAGARNWTVHFHRALAWMGKGDRAKSEAEMRKALALAEAGPDRVRVREALRYVTSTAKKGVDE